MRWLFVNNLILSVSKSHSLKFTLTYFSYSLGGDPLSFLNSFQVLGSVLGDKLRFNNRTVDRASKISDFVLYSSPDVISIQPILTLFLSLWIAFRNLKLFNAASPYYSSLTRNVPASVLLISLTCNNAESSLVCAYNYVIDSSGSSDVIFHVTSRKAHSVDIFELRPIHDSSQS